jgi:hypothetical protein
MTSAGEIRHALSWPSDRKEERSISLATTTSSPLGHPHVARYVRLAERKQGHPHKTALRKCEHEDSAGVRRFSRVEVNSTGVTTTGARNDCGEPRNPVFVRMLRCRTCRNDIWC